MSDWYGLTGEYYGVDTYYDPEVDDRMFRFSYTDAMSPRQVNCFNTFAAAARKRGETDLKKIFTCAVEQFNQEAARQGWVVRIVLS